MTEKKILNLDDVTEDIEVVLVVNGKEHKLKPLSVEDYIANVKSIERLQAQSDPEEEMNLVMKMLMRAFPTFSDDDLKGLTMKQLTALQEAAINGSFPDEKPEEGDELGEEKPEGSPEP